LRLWSGLGYYSRARNLQNAARQIVAKFGGVFPKTREEILSLSGIGDYTASAIASIAFNERAAVLDGNVARVLSRSKQSAEICASGANGRHCNSKLIGCQQHPLPGDWNQAMMELGAIICTPRAPQCLLCPVATPLRSAETGNHANAARSEEKARRRGRRAGKAFVLGEP